MLASAAPPGSETVVSSVISKLSDEISLWVSVISSVIVVSAEVTCSDTVVPPSEARLPLTADLLPSAIPDRLQPDSINANTTTYSAL